MACRRTQWRKSRRQAWVARRLGALVPRIDEDALCNALAQMLTARRDNIAWTRRCLWLSPDE
ncbi:DUF6306 domain-containing protein [Variovorax ginsengisoli]|uniref:DUF6306 domain-containing protein n=1 Tax=Variovorax ginsengisoli TaxID=363844 RepID=UPI003452C63E